MYFIVFADWFLIESDTLFNTPNTIGIETRNLDAMSTRRLGAENPKIEPICNHVACKLIQYHVTQHPNDSPAFLIGSWHLEFLRILLPVKG